MASSQPTAKPTIVIYRSSTGWIADFSHSAHAHEMRFILGTDQVPTPYTPTASPNTVRAGIAARNQDHEVIIRNDSRT